MSDIRVFRYRGLVRIRRRTLIKLWLHRRWLRLKYGQDLLDLMDDCAARVERAILHGEEHMLDD